MTDEYRPRYWHPAFPFGNFPYISYTHPEDFKLEPGARGIVVQSRKAPLFAEQESLSIVDPQMLRFGLLYWDRVATFQDPRMYLVPTEEERILIDQNFLVRKVVELRGEWGHPEHSVPIHLGGMNLLHHKSAGGWAMEELDGDIPAWYADTLHRDANLAVRLAGCFGVPATDTPLEEILEFKFRRTPELHELRHYLDKLSRSVSEAEDHDEILAQQLDALDLALAAQIRVFREWRFPVRLVNYKVKLSWKSFLAAGEAYRVTLDYGFPAVSSTLAGIAAGAVCSVEAEIAFREKTLPAAPVQYAAKFRTEIF